MPIFRITVITTKIANGQRIDKGLYVDIQTYSFANPIYNEKGEVTNLSKPIKIGNHVWIGKHAKVLKGITIHDNAVVGMSTIVTKDVPTNTLVAGSDCRIIRSDINWDRKFITV